MLKMLFSTGAIASALFLSQGFGVSGEAQARKIVKPNATGIGYANSRYRARRYSLRAWKKAVRRAYGPAYAKYFRALNKKRSCYRIGRKRFGIQSRRFNRNVIGTIGNPNKAWTCVTEGRPVKFGAGPIRPIVKPMATGIGYGPVKVAAQGLAIRAWANAVRRRYGPAYDDYGRARSKSLSCHRIGYRTRGFKKFSHRGGVIGVEGNPNSPWVCEAKGRPSR